MPFGRGFGVKFKGRSIWERPTLESGITFDTPLLQWALAAQWWGYTWHQWQRIMPDEQAFLVAVYQTRQQIDGVMAFARFKQARQQARRPRSGG